MNAEDICRSMMQAELEAGQIILKASDVAASSKSGSRDLVTQFDVQVQHLLESRLTEAIADAVFFCEEMNEQGSLSADHVFIIDPIDGTMNFIRGFSCSCISAAYAEKGEILAAAVYNPYLDEMFHAVKGGGAFLNGRPIRVSGAPLRESIVCFGTSPFYEELADATFRLCEKVFHSSLDVRRNGSAALDLCNVACGRAGLFFEYRLSLWDFAAGSLIVSEAGGRCTQMDGDPLPVSGSGSSVLAGGEQAVKDFFFLTNT